MNVQPAVTRLWFRIDGQSTNNYVDLSLACSAANRRFYRQGLTWAVAGMSVLTTPDTSGDAPKGDFTVAKIPDTWVAKNAHTKAKMLWMKSQQQVLADQPSVAAKYRDFKVYLDDDMVGSVIQDTNTPATTGQTLMPVDSQDFITKKGEWIYSTIQLPEAGGSAQPVEITMHMLGNDDANSRGIIKGYGLSRTRPQAVDPNTPTAGGWMNDVFDVADNLDEIREDVTENNDVPPYRIGAVTEAIEYYPGGQNNAPSAALHSINLVSGTTIGGKTHVEGGMFACGLMRIGWDLKAVDTVYLAIDLVPGTQKGYLTEAY